MSIEVQVNYKLHTNREEKKNLNKYINNSFIHSFAGFLITSGSDSSLGLFYSIYLGPEIKNLEETPYYGRETFTLGQKRGLSHLFFA